MLPAQGKYTTDDVKLWPVRGGAAAPLRAGSEKHKVSSDFGVYQNGGWDSEEGEQAETLQLDMGVNNHEGL